MSARSVLRDLRHYSSYVLDQVALGVFQAVAITVDKVMDSRAPVDVSRAEAHREALVAAEEHVEVWGPSSEAEWLGNSRDPLEDPASRWDECNTGFPAASAGGGARSGRGESVPPRPPATPLTTWLTPAICEVLAEHEPATFEDQTRVSCADDVRANHYQVFRDQQSWREHVAPLIAERVANLLPLIQPQ